MPATCESLRRSDGEAPDAAGAAATASSGRVSWLRAGGRASRQEQLAGVAAELADTRRRAHQITAAAEGERWNARPAADQWSAADCLVHLDLTSRAFLWGQTRAPASARRYRIDLMGRLLWIAATISLPVKTTERFVPVPEQPKEAVLTEFDALQARQLGFVETAVQVDLGTLLIVSPFDPRLRYNLYSCLRLIAAHQRQQLRQTERVLAEIPPPAGTDRPFS